MLKRLCLLSDLIAGDLLGDGDRHIRPRVTPTGVFLDAWCHYKRSSELVIPD
jgi:hypothetical protein